MFLDNKSEHDVDDDDDDPDKNMIKEMTYLFSKLFDVVSLLPNNTSNLLALHDKSNGQGDRGTSIGIEDNFGFHGHGLSVHHHVRMGCEIIVVRVIERVLPDDMVREEGFL